MIELVFVLVLVVAEGAASILEGAVVAASAVVSVVGALAAAAVLFPATFASK